jgi:hypothetical protein
MIRLFRRRTGPSLEEQLQILAECGIRSRPGITTDHLLRSGDRALFEADPFRLAAVRLGGEAEEPPYEPFSDDIWHFDTECIENEGDYVAIAERMRDLAGGALPLTAIRDAIDWDENKAWLEFELDGATIHWDLKLEDDWVDPTLFGRFAVLLAGRDGARRFTYLDLMGQDCLIGCSPPEQLGALQKKTGLKFTWLR